MGKKSPSKPIVLHCTETTGTKMPSLPLLFFWLLFFWLLLLFGRCMQVRCSVPNTPFWWAKLECSLQICPSIAIALRSLQICPSIAIALQICPSMAIALSSLQICPSIAIALLVPNRIESSTAVRAWGVHWQFKFGKALLNDWVMNERMNGTS